MVEWSRAKFCDVVNLFLGTILFFSPWLFSLSLGTPRQTAAIAGLFIAVLSVTALRHTEIVYRSAEEIRNALLGRGLPPALLDLRPAAAKDDDDDIVD